MQSSLPPSSTSQHPHIQSVHPPPPPPSLPPPPPQQSSANPSTSQQTSPVQQQQQQQQRRRFPIQPPTLATALGGPAARHGLIQSAVPASAVTGALPFSPASAVVGSLSALPVDSSAMASRSISATMNAYNPLEWTRHGGPTSSNYMPHTSTVARRRALGTQNATGMEASMPSPPPPYSPSPVSAAAPSSRLARVSPHMSSFTGSTTSPSLSASEYGTPVTATSVPGPSTLSPAQNIMQDGPPSSFPPPPGASQRDRSSSRSRFNLSALAARARGHDATAANNAMDTLQRQTAEALARAPGPPSSYFPLSVQAPSARRAASAGSARPPSRQEDFHNTEDSPSYGMALPGPPPGPPPNGSRSQSVNRVADRHTDFGPGASLLPLRAALRRTNLEPVPPTPANWVDEDQSGEPSDFAGQEWPTNGDRPGQRDLAVNRSIRERRSESRAARSASREPLTAIEATGSAPWATDSDAAARPADLVLSGSRGALGRRRHVSKSKTSPLFSNSDSPHVQRLKAENPSDRIDASPGPSSAPAPSAGSGKAPMPTPPSSASGGPALDLRSLPNAQTHRPKDLPTPETGNDFEVLPTTSSVASDMTPGLRSAASIGPLRPNSRLENSGTGADEFAQASMDRFRNFVEAEASAPDDHRRLELFADFIVQESRIRRDRYSAAFDNLGSDVLELTRDLWRSNNHGRPVKTPVSASMMSSSGGGGVVAARNSSHGTTASVMADSTPASAASTPRTSQDSPRSIASVGRERSGSQRAAHAYQPALSPIPSMAMSTIPDDESSRGRAQSRWWEASIEGGSIGFGRKVERTKRESKYMGVPRELLQRDYEASPPAFPVSAGPSQTFANLGPNEYPPEKTGWHEDRPSSRLAFDAAQDRSMTPSLPKLDIQRLITLPPPYPRHHPAVNNSHPELASLRQNLRNITDRTFLEEARASYEATRINTAAIESAVDERRQQMRRQIHDQVTQGSMSFADAARAETQFEEREAQYGKDEAQKAFDEFQKKVMSTVSAHLTEKINASSATMDQLRESLSDDARSMDPTLTQEEGDEKPEMLEKLTLLKWIFEAREGLHQEMFELESESDDMYKQVILMPYRLSGSQEKIAEVDSFFTKDKRDRLTGQHKKSVRRYEAFLNIVEQHVTRGVELQSSAFWDIAPPLLALIQKVPANMTGFNVHIPAEEYDDNPSYDAHPLQYLYSVMTHAEKSAYQFIESQTNLFCLLHEVKTGVMVAGSKLIETQRAQAGEDAVLLEQEMKAARDAEDRRLTNDLKDKVDVVENQWREALGSGMDQCKVRVKDYLERNAGWSEELVD